MLIKQNPYQPPIVPEDPLDDLAAAGVRDRLSWMQTSAGLFQGARYKREVFAQVEEAVTDMEAALGRPLPLARAALARIAGDGWTQL